MESRKTIWIVISLVIILAVQAPGARAQEYVIGAEDRLEITFWQDPALNVQVNVGLDGKIGLDIVGQIEAAGKTTAQLQNDIVRLISRLNKNISQATVRVVQFNYNHVFVIGQVNQPGKYSFERIPDLWTIINEAGGLAELGDLSRVTIIRGGDEAGRIEVVDIRAALAAGDLARLPKLGRQDTIEIGRAPGRVLGGDVGPVTERKNLIYVIGAVNAPGAVTYEEDIDVLEAIALAGGPTESADLKGVRLMLKDGSFAQAIKINLSDYTNTGRPARYIMQKEDMVYLPVRRPGFFDSTIGRIATVLTVVSTTYLIVDQVRSD
jgi:protein involved in polysaccharide export with SLBB domain